MPRQKKRQNTIAPVLSTFGKKHFQGLYGLSFRPADLQKLGISLLSVNGFLLLFYGVKSPLTKKASKTD
jgi:hypothetical protein